MVAGVVIMISHYILVDRAYQFLHIRPATGPRKAGIGICNYGDDYLPVGAWITSFLPTIHELICVQALAGFIQPACSALL